MPKGIRKSGQFTHYNPKRWQPEFDLIVTESVAGKSNEEIGRIFGYTKEHVSNILSTTEAQKIKERIRETINSEFDVSLKDRIANIGNKAMEKIEAFISDDELYSRSPFMFVDRAIKLAQSTSALGLDSSRGGNTTIVNGNAIVMNNNQADNIRDALLKSSELDSIKPGDKVEVRDINDGRLRLEA